MDSVHNGVDMEDGKTMSSYEFNSDDNLILVTLRVGRGYVHILWGDE